MTVESATYIGSLNSALPSGSDAKAEGDDHIRLTKSVLLATFPGMTGAMTGTHTQLNKLVSTFSIVSASANALTIDSSGNVGIGTGASAWNAASKALQLAGGASLEGRSATGLSLGTNWYYGASGDIFQASGSAYKLTTGSGFSFLFATGTAGGAITWSQGLSLDSSGNLITNVNGSAPSLTANQTLVFSLASDTQLRISVRGADGLTRAVILTLA